LVAAAEKKNEQVHGLTLELDAVAVAAKFVAAEVKFENGGGLIQALHGVLRSA